MQKWYVYRKGKEIKIAHVDQAGAHLLHEKGYELGKRPYDNKDEAERVAADWRKKFGSKT